MGDFQFIFGEQPSRVSKLQSNLRIVRHDGEDLKTKPFQLKSDSLSQVTILLSALSGINVTLSTLLENF